METLQFTEKHQRFRERLRSFLKQEVIPNIEKWENDHIVPKSIWKKAGKEGFLCTSVLPEYGGMGGDFLYSLIAARRSSGSIFEQTRPMITR